MTIATLPDDVKDLQWVADQLGIGLSTAYRLAPKGAIPGAFKVGAQWRVSVPAFMRDVHGTPLVSEMVRNHAERIIAAVEALS